MTLLLGSDERCDRFGVWWLSSNGALSSFSVVCTHGPLQQVKILAHKRYEAIRSSFLRCLVIASLHCRHSSTKSATGSSAHIHILHRRGLTERMCFLRAISKRRMSTYRRPPSHLLPLFLPMSLDSEHTPKAVSQPVGLPAPLLQDSGDQDGISPTTSLIRCVSLSTLLTLCTPRPTWDAVRCSYALWGLEWRLDGLKRHPLRRLL